MKLQKKQDETIVSFCEPMTSISSAILGGGIRRNITSVANITISKDLNVPASLMFDYCESVLDLAGVDSKNTVALLTSVPQIYLGQSACGKCLVTAGLGNACPLIPENVWDEKRDEMMVYRPGTINCILVLSDSLSQSALVEAYGMVKVAISEVVRFWSLCRGDYVYVGTPTDCTALFCPQNGPKIKFAGLGTKIGADIVTSVVDAMTNAIRHRYPDFKNLVHEI